MKFEVDQSGEFGAGKKPRDCPIKCLGLRYNQHSHCLNSTKRLSFLSLSRHNVRSRPYKLSFQLFEQ